MIAGLPPSRRRRSVQERQDRLKIVEDSPKKVQRWPQDGLKMAFLGFLGGVIFIKVWFSLSEFAHFGMFSGSVLTYKFSDAFLHLNLGAQNSRRHHRFQRFQGLRGPKQCISS